MQLRALAGAQGSFDAAFSIGSGTTRIDVRFGTDHDRRRLTTMILSIAYDLASRASAGQPPLVATRPLSIELRKENIADVSAKDGGVSYEWQASDPAFDDHVYVSTPTSEPAVLARVLNPAVRAGVLQLMQLGFERILIDDDGKLEARAPAENLKPSWEADRAERVVASFCQIAAHVPPLQHSGQKRARPPLAGWSTAMFLIGGAGWVLSVPLFALVGELLHKAAGRDAAHHVAVLPVLGCLALALVVGFYAGRGYGRRVERLAMGRSDAHTLGSSASIRGFGAFSVIVFYASYALLVLFG